MLDVDWHRPITLAQTRVNPNGDELNAIPTAGLDFYGIFRAYEPEPDLVFPEVKRIN
ncbi:MAG: hypothetical protein ABFR95_00530 [Actinomycetota bacterium]